MKHDLVAIICLMILAGVGGWSLRAMSADHRMVRAAYEKNEAQRRYFDAKLESMIEDNIVKYGRPVTVGKREGK